MRHRLRHSSAGPGSPLNAVRAQAHATAHLRQRIEKRVGRRIVCLAGSPENPACGREEDEEVQLVLQRLLMKIPGSRGFWRHHSREAIGGLLRDDAVVEDAGEMKDALQVRAAAIDGASYIFRTRNISRHDFVWRIR